MDKLLHIGVKRRSGRYPWGSGEDPYQGLNGYSFLKSYESLKEKGFSEKDIATKLNMNTTQLRNSITWATKERREFIQSQTVSLSESGMNNTMIARKLGISEASVRNYLAPKEKVQKVQLENVRNAIAESVEKHGYIDVGVGVERQLGISRTKLNTVVNKMVEEGEFHVHDVYVRRLTDPTGSKSTTVKVITKEPDLKTVVENSHKIRDLDKQSDDRAMTIVNIKPPVHVDFDRIKVRYAEEGGADFDGLIELRPGVADLDLGNSKYAQVRIAAGEKSYLKGMVAYGDDKDFPKGVDIIFNTNKDSSVPKEKVFKNMKDDADNPFGTTIKKQKGALNIVNEEGDWDTWSTKMSSQFLSKQPAKLIKDRLDATTKALQKEFDEINELTNPVVKKHLMDKYVEGLDTKAKHLKAQGLAGTKNHVLLPINSIKPNEIYAPHYKDGEPVVLVRHPHGGTFEIPQLIVNNKNAKARRMLGMAPDAVAIHPSVAAKLSGADFDGDTALVIPNRNGDIKFKRSLKELKNFEPSMYKVDHATITPKAKQMQMGLVSNLITDMTIKGASDSEIARAVKHSMVVIDSEKHNLDWKKSARDNGIAALTKKYQSHINPDTGRPSKGASTLISRSKRKVDISDPNFDPYKYSSGTITENLYAGYISNVQSIKNQATKASLAIKMPTYSKDAAKVYDKEIKSLNEKLNKALLNAPKERQAQLLTNHLYYSNVKDGMDKDDKKKLVQRSLTRSRTSVGAKKEQIKITDNEWEAIQANAISTSKLKSILDNADMDTVRKLATPKYNKVTSSGASRARSMFANGYTYAQIAEALGVSASTVRDLVK